MPRIISESITTTSAMIEWDAWSLEAGDTGDGPIVAYNIYDLISGTLIESVTINSETATPISVSMQNLSPNTVHNVNVRPVREGPGGEGSSTQFVVVKTLSSNTGTDMSFQGNKFQHKTQKDITKITYDMKQFYST